MVADHLNQRSARRVLGGAEDQPRRGIQPADDAALDENRTFLGMVEEGGRLADLSGIARGGPCMLGPSVATSVTSSSPEPRHPGPNLAKAVAGPMKRRRSSSGRR